MTEFLNYLGIILGSSVGVALINWAATARVGKADRVAAADLQTQREQHEATLQAQREEHESRLRREAAHDEARETFLPLSEALVLYFTKEAFDLHWDEVGIFTFPSTERPVLDTRAKVVDATRSIMWGHPTPHARAGARTIYDNLVSYRYDTDRAQAQWLNDERIGLSQDEANQLERAAEELIQLIQAPVKSRAVGRFGDIAFGGHGCSDQTRRSTLPVNQFGGRPVAAPSRYLIAGWGSQSRPFRCVHVD